MHFFTGDVWTVPSCPTLVTLHDLAPLQMPEIFFKAPEQEEAYRRHIETVFEVSERVVTVSEYSRDDLIRRDVIKQLICNFTLDPKEIEAAYDIQFTEYFADDLKLLQAFINDGLVETDKQKLRVTATGRLLIRNICMCFDIYVRQKARQQQFSRVI